jgi:hypothetical protein
LRRPCPWEKRIWDLIIWKQAVDQKTV